MLLYEASEYAKAVLRQNALGMKLDTLDRILQMPDTHDVSIIRRGGGHGQLLRQTLMINDQRMVAGRFDRAPLGVGVDATTIVLNGADLAMHHMVGPNDRTAECQTDGLVPKAYPQNRQAPFEVLDDFDIAGILRMARARPQDAKIWSIGFDTLDQVRNIIALHMGFQPQLLKVLADDEHKLS